MAKGLAIDRLPAFTTERPGVKHIFRELLGPNFRLPCHATVAKIQQDLLEDVRASIRVEVQTSAVAGLPAVTVSSDLWEAPDGTHFQAQLLHYVTDFTRKKALLYLDRLGTDKTSANQAQRICAIFRDRGLDTDCIYASLSDCTGNARNIARDLKVQMALCSAHITALDPRKQVFMQPRRERGVERLAVHETANEEVVAAFERIRARAKTHRFSERHRRDLDCCQKYVGLERPLRVQIDCSSKWNSTLSMCENDFRLRAAYLELRSRFPDRSDVSTVSNNLQDYILSRDFAGVLRPFELCTELLQKGNAPASIVLPCHVALAAQLEAVPPPASCLPPTTSHLRPPT